MRKYNRAFGGMSFTDYLQTQPKEVRDAAIKERNRLHKAHPPVENKAPERCKDVYCLNFNERKQNCSNPHSSIKTCPGFLRRVPTDTTSPYTGTGQKTPCRPPNRTVNAIMALPSRKEGDKLRDHAALARRRAASKKWQRRQK